MDRYRFSFCPVPGELIEGVISVTGYSGAVQVLEVADFSLQQGGNDIHELVMPSSCVLQVAQRQLYELLPLLDMDPRDVRLRMTRTRDGQTFELWGGLLAMEAFEQDVSYQVSLVELPFSCGLNRLRNIEFPTVGAFVSPVSLLRSCLLQLGQEMQVGISTDLQDEGAQDYTPSSLLERDVVHDSVFYGRTCWEVMQEVAQLYGLRMARIGAHVCCWPMFSTTHLMPMRYWRLDALYPSSAQHQRYKRIGDPGREVAGELALQGRQRAVIEKGIKELRVSQQPASSIPAIADAYQSGTEIWDQPNYGLAEPSLSQLPDGAFFRVDMRQVGNPSVKPSTLAVVDTVAKCVRWDAGPLWYIDGSRVEYTIAAQRQYVHFAYTPKLDVRFTYRMRKKPGQIVLMRNSYFRVFLRVVDTESGKWIWLDPKNNAAWPTNFNTGYKVAYDREQERSYEQQVEISFDFAAGSSSGQSDYNGFDLNSPRMVQLQLMICNPFPGDTMSQADFEMFSWEFSQFSATLTPSGVQNDTQDEVIYHHDGWGTRTIERELSLREEPQRLNLLGAVLRRKDAAPFAPISSMRELTAPGSVKRYYGDISGQPAFTPLGMGRADAGTQDLFDFAARPLHTLELELRDGTALALWDCVRFDQDGAYGDYWVAEMEQKLHSCVVKLVRQKKNSNTWE